MYSRSLRESTFNLSSKVLPDFGSLEEARHLSTVSWQATLNQNETRRKAHYLLLEHSVRSVRCRSKCFCGAFDYVCICLQDGR